MTKEKHAIEIYWNLMRKEIARSKNRAAVKAIPYKEEHHIIPKCAGGTNDKWNRIQLSVREHMLAHKLLKRAGYSDHTTSDDETSVISAAVRVLYGHKNVFKMFGDHANDMYGIYHGISDEKEAKKLFKKLIKQGIIKVDKSRL